MNQSTSRNQSAAAVSSSTNRILVFDVETTGLLPKNSRLPEDCPYITQLSYIVWDMNLQTAVEMYDTYISVPEEVAIAPIITELTGVTRQLLNLRGIPIEHALRRFCRAYNEATVVVAHNLSFDKDMILVEMSRNGIQFPLFTNQLQANTYCTMRATTIFCDLWNVTKNGARLRKWPKLVELYQKLFDETPENLHNSMMDTAVALRCYLFWEHQFQIPINRWYHLIDGKMFKRVGGEPKRMYTDRMKDLYIENNCEDGEDTISLNL